MKTKTGARVVQPPKTDEQLLWATRPGANAEEIKAATCSCVVHLCGCDNAVDAD